MQLRLRGMRSKKVNTLWHNENCSITFSYSDVFEMKTAINLFVGRSS